MLCPNDISTSSKRVTHACYMAVGVDRAFSSVCDFVCLSVCLFVCPHSSREMAWAITTSKSVDIIRGKPSEVKRSRSVLGLGLELELRSATSGVDLAANTTALFSCPGDFHLV